MAKKSYQLKLKGYVGSWDFDSDYVDYVLGKHDGEEVNVLINSTGGSVATALTISAAFKNHGKVNCHYVGMNASAATFASLGAQHISIDANAMYLVHKCSIGFFEWGSKNADNLEQMIAELDQQKKDLDKIDMNVASMYAAKCKKDKKCLLDLMKVGGWLSAEEALEWGFVDEITDAPEDAAPVLDDKTLHAFASAGIPLPNNVRMNEKDSSFGKFLASLQTMFNKQTTKIGTKMSKKFTEVCKILTLDNLEFAEGKISMTEAQMQQLEDGLTADKTKINNLQTNLNAKCEEIKTLKGKPAEETSAVVDEPNGKSKEKTAMDEYFDTVNNAKEMFNQLS